MLPLFKRTAALALFAGLALAPGTPPATAAPLSTQPLYALHAFSGPDGSHPNVLIQGGDGSLYGTTARGGANSTGTVYKIAPDGTETTLYSFSPLISHPGGGLTDPSETNSDGAYPAGLARDGSGNLWGVTSGGGANGGGTVFKIAQGSPPGSPLSFVYTFSHLTSRVVSYPGVNGTTASEALLVNPDGAGPSALTLGRDGNIYGTASGGGANGNGTVFKVTPGGAVTALYTFSQTHLRPGSAIPVESPNDFLNSDGATPQAAPLVSGNDGTLYGVTSTGGPDGLGTFFKVTLGGAETTLSAPGNGYLYTVAGGIVNGSQTFATTLQTFPVSLTVGAGGSLYGTTGIQLIGVSRVGTGGTATFTGGTVFQMTPAGAMTTLFSFPETTLPRPQNTPLPADGDAPSSIVQAADGTLYGTTLAGAANDAGTVFKLVPDAAGTTGYSVQTLYVVVQDGAGPANLLLAQDGNLYGTGGGGVNGNGVVFEVAPTPPTFVLHSFNGLDGFDPVSLLFGNDGNLYGATYSSTLNGSGIGDGTFFTLTTGSTPAHDTLRVLYDQFHYTRNNTGVIQGTNGLFYGTTMQQGPGPQGYGAGGIYSMSAGGLLTDLYDFPGGGNPAIGGTPAGGVIQKGGLLYGTTNTSVFAFNPVSKVLTPLHTFVPESNGPGLTDDGSSPGGNLLLASDGKLYGVTQRGGHDPNSGEGTIYSVDPAAAAPGYGFRVLHRFDPAMEGGNSPGALVEKDGVLYGTTGAIYYRPAVFKINKDGSGFQILHAFSNTEGIASTTPLVAAGDGFLYGMVGFGGGGGGNIFRISTDGDFRIVYRFSGPDGEDHYNGDFVAPLAQGPDGNLYGVAGSGGLYGYNFNEPYIDGFGTIFRLATARPGPHTAPPLHDVTAQIAPSFQPGGYVMGAFRYLVTLRNTGGALAGPVFLVVDGLPAGTTLLNAAGYTNQAPPAGSPYVAAGGGLAAGAAVGVSLQTNRPLMNGLFHVRVLSGSGTP